jgi:hypothetical protein
VTQRAVPTIYTLIESCNRSAPHVKLLQTALSILVNVASAPKACMYNKRRRRGGEEGEEKEKKEKRRNRIRERRVGGGRKEKIGTRSLVRVRN